MNLMLICVNDVNFSKNLAAVLSSLCIKYCKKLIKICIFMSICVLECVFVIYMLFIVIYMSIYVKSVAWTTVYIFFPNDKNTLTGASSHGI